MPLSLETKAKIQKYLTEYVSFGALELQNVAIERNLQLLMNGIQLIMHAMLEMEK